MEKKQSKKALKRAEKGDHKLEQKVNDLEIDDISAHLYGEKFLDNANFIKVNNIDEKMAGDQVLIKGRIHQIRKKGKQVFLVLRQSMSTIQVIGYVDERRSKQMINFIGDIEKESFVEIQGHVKLVEKKIESCTQSDVEIEIEAICVLARSKSRLPLQIEDCMRREVEGSTLATVNLDTRLDNRVLDLRTPTNHAIFKISGAVREYFRQFLIGRQFEEITTPNLISAASEGGAGVFEVKYFDEKAYLAQSPQLYKQMAICAGFDRVFCIGPVSRAENSNTHRHLTEFTGLDVEMCIDRHYHEVLDTICSCMVHIFTQLQLLRASEIATVNKQYPAEPFDFITPTLVLTFAEGVAMLREAGVEMGDFEDLSTPNEKLLGRLVKRKFGTDFFALDRFPSAVRPFYTMPDAHDARYSNSYDLFMRGEEILSGAQRIHNPDQLRQSAINHGINLETIRDYLESFECGVGPHGGGGIGLERVVMLFLGIDNIRKCSMFPRDPKRLRP